MDEKKVEKLKELNRYVSMYCFDKTVPGGTQKTVELLDLLHECEQALAPQPRFYVGQPVLVSHNKDQYVWYKRRYASFSDEGLHHIQATEESGSMYWEFCKPDPDAVSLPNWIEHDGGSDMPIMDDVYVDTIADNGDRSSERADKFEWKYIVRYQVSPLPEWINP